MENKNELNKEYKESLRLALRDFFVILDWSCKTERDRFNFIMQSDGITIGYFKDYKPNQLDLEGFKRLKSDKIKESIMEFDNSNLEGPIDISEQFIKNIGSPVNIHSGNCFMSIAMAKLDSDTVDEYMAKDRNLFRSDELIQKFMEKQREALNFYIFMNRDIHIFMYSLNIISNDGYVPSFNRDFIYENTAFIITGKNNLPINSGNIAKIFKKEELPLFLVDV